MIKSERRNRVERICTEECTHGQCGNDRGKNERTENFHGHRAKHDLGDKQSAGDGSIVGRSDPRGCAAANEQAQAWSGPFSEPAGKRSRECRKLNQRTLAPDRSTGSDREKRGETFKQRASRGDFPITEHDSFHVVGGCYISAQSRAELKDRTGQ